MPEENDLEGPQDQGGKHGGQAGMPEPPARPREADRKDKAVGDPRPSRTRTGEK